MTEKIMTKRKITKTHVLGKTIKTLKKRRLTEGLIQNYKYIYEYILKFIIFWMVFFWKIIININNLIKILYFKFYVLFLR